LTTYQLEKQTKNGGICPPFKSFEIIAYRYTLGTKKWYLLCYNPAERYIIQKIVAKLNVVNKMGIIQTFLD
tara:strand:- start:89 stop:301 length:213 start_codon:yes stop_codon:yes gene_type:complete